MFRRKIFYSIFSAVTISLAIPAHACTDFLLKSEDGAHVNGRSLEFGMILPTQIRSFAPGPQQSSAPNKKGMSWTGKYGYVGLVFKPANIVIDGLNEKGLSVGALWLPGTKYPELNTADPSSALFFADISSWLLGSFANVEEAISAIQNVQIFADKIPGFSDIPPVHFTLHDESGKSAVVEFLRGKTFVFDNPVGVLTNSPEFPWHLTNLRNYINLSALNAGKINLDGTVLEQTGQGSGLLGLPGDWTPPSRFVRTAVIKQALETPKDSESAVLAAIHLLNTVDIPYGAIRASQDKEFDFTQWIVVKDLKNKKLYYRTYENQNIYVLDVANNLANPKTIELNSAP